MPVAIPADLPGRVPGVPRATQERLEFFLQPLLQVALDPLAKMLLQTLPNHA